MADLDVEFEPGFEPQSRPRSCTWPLRRPEFLDNSKPTTPGAEQQGTTAVVSEESPQQPQIPSQLAGDAKVDLTTPTTQRKNGSRRNAWGNLSYADLITKAIQAAPEQRLTLAQIYEWMVKNVPFFKDKGDSNSSAGWKNSIRHNLSLHSRFVRVQNEGTGKSSWWMINPDAKPGKSSRRRASSMDTTNPKFEKKRGRAKKKALEERQKWSSSPTPKLDGSEDGGPLAFTLGPNDFRSRASSNASSCGRLSPIMAARSEHSDMHDNEVPPMSPIPFADQLNSSHPYDNPDQLHTDQLASMAQNMSLNSSLSSPLNDQLSTVEQQLTVLYQSGPNSSNGYLYSPPGSNYSNSELSPARSGVQSPYSSYSQPATPAMSPINQPQCSPMGSISDMQQQYNGMNMQQAQTYQGVLSQTAGILSQQDPILPQSSEPNVIRQPGHSPAMLPSCREQSNMVHRSPNATHRYVTQTQQGYINSTPLSTLLNISQQHQGGIQQLHSSSQMGIPNGRGAYPHHSHAVPQQAFQAMQMQGEGIPIDLDTLQVDEFQNIECDMESIIRNEIAIGDGFNINFENINTGTVTSSPSWVH